MQTVSILRRAARALFSIAGAVVGAFALTLLVTAGAFAQQPASVNPTASSVNEQKLLEALGPQGNVGGRVTIPDARSRTLIQPEGRTYRAERDQSAKIGGLSILGILGLLVVFYLIRGKVRITGGRSGETMTRFGFMDRFAHWLTATSFLLLGFTGLNITFGRSLVLPVIGPDAFTALSQSGKFVHNYVSFAFLLGILLMFLMWAKDNFPALRDIRWFLQGGGLIGLGHPPAGRFNGGQKLIFWSVVLGGAAISFTGYILMFPFQWTDVAGMQWASVWHGILGLVLFAIIIAHIYIGSVGMEGAFEAMGSGEVDVKWAREHHSVWVEKVAAKSGKTAPAE
ncbi:MAG: formate dehydrogenase subunit gamma [Hyphomicrobium sp.]|nr:MAG: formate dehydrogenase subunit gamma [Hyphomicrobium sp.]